MNCDAMIIPREILQWTYYSFMRLKQPFYFVDNYCIMPRNSVRFRISLEGNYNYVKGLSTPPPFLFFWSKKSAWFRYNLFCCPNPLNHFQFPSNFLKNIFWLDNRKICREIRSIRWPRELMREPFHKVSMQIM